MKGEPGPIGDPGTPGIHQNNYLYISIITVFYIKINVIDLLLVTSILIKGLTQ